MVVGTGEICLPADVTDGRSFAEQSRVDVAVSARIFVKIVLMIFFGRIEVGDCLMLNCRTVSDLFAETFERGADCLGICLIGLIYTGAVLGADIVSLSVECRRVDCLKI